MNFKEYISSIPKYHNVISDITNNQNKNIYISQSSANISLMLAVLAFEQTHKNIVYVCENIYNASIAYEKMCDMAGTDNVSFYPVEEFISSELVASSPTFRLARMLTLYNISENNPKIIVTSCEGATKQIMSKAKLDAAILKLHLKDIYSIKKLTQDLINRGYKRCAICENSGTFSMRGSIVDIYPINESDVIRVNFFDDEIDSIKKVSIETQLSTEHLDKIEIFPLYDIYYDEEEIPLIEQSILKVNKKTEKVEKDLEHIKNYESLDQLSIYLPYIDKEYISFIEYANNPLCFYEDINHILSHEVAEFKELAEYFRATEFVYPKDFFISIRDIIGFNKHNIFTSPETVSLNDIKLDKLIHLNTMNNFNYGSNLKSVMNDLLLNQTRTYIITHFDEAKKEFLKEVFNSNNISYYDDEHIHEGKINLLVSKDAYGFIDNDLNIEVLTPNEFASGKINKQSKYQKYYKKSTKIYDKDDLHPGDYVIHQDYGIGIYLGIEARNIRNHDVDFLSIQYADNQKLLVPVENIYRLEKYNPPNDATPKLNNLSGKEWSKKKAKVKERVLEVAKRLIKVQAERELRQGYIYKPDSTDQQIFESDFEFTETIDQAKAINDVKNDMESTKPVDRLICGDVGFGKTEVAMRAAFKAVDNGKQVAYLAPTTVLSRQHYYTFKERLEKYGVKVELLNRFVSPQRQKQVIEGLKTGYVDILIGTHRILSKDIEFKDLGLLIVDEEQRFGVTHKERIKEMKANVDVLTLTATPIPRTLQMSLSGLRDLSLIETPPVNRLPIQTYVLEYNESVIREAINREMGRGGQIFYLLNRVNALESVINKIHKLCQNARIGLIHGQMNKDDIEEQLEMFLDKQYDVLVCTTIIETGIDIPNANTLIIEQADCLGLSQLYQIRGRVGRSDRISYAYLTYNKDKVLTEVAKKRLDTIKEFTALGSGYRIAMRDLAIRGAGDILGEEQSGFIDAIGIDLYTSMLNEAVDELKGTIKVEEPTNNLHLTVNKHVDTSYVSDDEIRIDIHKEISKIRSRDQINLLISEYTDRFGKLPEDILIYMESKYLEFLMKSKGIEHIKELQDEITINFDYESSRKINYQNFRNAALTYIKEAEFSLRDGMIYITINQNNFKKNYVYALTAFFEHI